MGEDCAAIVMNEQGEAIPLPEGLIPNDHAGPRLIPAMDEAGLYGYVNLAGEVVILPQYLEAEPFSEGLAVVMPAPGIDTTGAVILRGLDEASDFLDGYASVLINGYARYAVAGGSLWLAQYSENGLGWYCHSAHEYQLIDREGNAVSAEY